MAVLGYAVLNTMRLNAARLNYGPATVYVTVGSAAMRARLAGAQVRDVINATPASCSVRVSDTIPALVPAFVAPQCGQDLAIKLGTTAPQSAIFAGQVLRRIQVKEGIVTNPPAFDLEGIDYTWRLDKRLAFGTYVGVSASTVAADLLARYASTFTTAIEGGLAPITLTFTGQPLSECLTQIATAVGGRWKVIGTVVHLFASAIHLPAPDLVTPLTVSDFVETIDLAQLRTRVYVKGIGVAVTAPAPVGSPTITVADTTPFADAPGGTVITDDGQIVKYTGKQAAGYAPGVPPGSSPILAPPPAPTPTAAADPPAVPLSFVSFTAGQTWNRCVTTAPHGFAVGQAVAFADQPFLIRGVVSAVVSTTEFQIATPGGGGGWTQNGGTVRAGTLITSIKARQGIATLTTAGAHNLAPGVAITIPSAAVAAFIGRFTIATTPSATSATFTISGTPADATDAIYFRSTAGALVGTYQYQATFASDTAETLPSPASSAITIGAVAPIDFTGATYVMQDLGQSVETLNKGLYPNNNYWYVLTAVDAAGHETQYGTLRQINTTPAPVTGNGQRVTWTIPAIGFADARIVTINVWRTPIRASAPTDASQIGFVGAASVPAAGGTISFVDEVRDSARGGPPPTANTTGGAVLVTAIATGDPRVTARRIYRNTPAAPTTYLRAGELGDNVVTAWLDTVLDTALATPAPTVAGTFGAPGQLTGIPPLSTGAIFYPLGAGSRVSIWVQRDDAAAQAAIAALEGGDGIHESRIDDGTIATVAAAQAAGDADLKLFRTAEAKCTFSGRDPKLQAGATVTVQFGPPTNVSKSYVIQSVTTTEIGIAGTLAPKRAVEAATTRYTLDDLLRRVALLED